MKKLLSWKSPVALALCLVQVLPIYITLTVALKGQTDLSSYWLLPAAAAWGNFAAALEAGGMLRALLNTAVITAGATALVLLVGAMAAYPLARSASRLNRGVMGFVLSIMMVPALSLLVPLYVLIVRMHAVSTFWGIALVHVTFNLPLAIFLYANFIKTIPRELDEAAVIDGSGIYPIYYRIILPLLKPVTVSIVILTTSAVWNDYQYSLYFLQKPSMRVLTLSIASFFGISGSDPHIAAAGALLAIIPMTALYLFLQKYFVKGMVDSALK
jgi:raffinose/stachyose/melibiose transport system permease protein